MKQSGDGRRVAKVEAEILRLVADYLIRHGRGELPGIVSVAQVKMPADFRAAKVYVSVLGADIPNEKVIAKLQSWASEIQRHIGANLHMRYCPKLTFYSDDMTEKILKVEGILQDLALQKNTKSSESPAVQAPAIQAENQPDEE